MLIFHRICDKSNAINLHLFVHPVDTMRCKRSKLWKMIIMSHLQMIFVLRMVISMDLLISLPEGKSYIPWYPHDILINPQFCCWNRGQILPPAPCCQPAAVRSERSKSWRVCWATAAPVALRWSRSLWTLADGEENVAGKWWLWYVMIP